MLITVTCPISLHYALPISLYEGATVHVRTRSEPARALARALGAASVGDSADPMPEPLDSALVFAPVGSLVPVARTPARSEEHTSELQSHVNLVCRLLLEKK